MWKILDCVGLMRTATGIVGAAMKNAREKLNIDTAKSDAVNQMRVKDFRSCQSEGCSALVLKLLLLPKIGRVAVPKKYARKPVASAPFGPRLNEEM